MSDLPSSDSVLLDPGLLASYLFRMSLAFGLALPVAWNREQLDRTAGLRTFPLVALAACGYVLLGHSFAQNDRGALARVLQGLITGVGFVGGGAILKSGDEARGTATAASIWCMGALGGAVALGRYEIAALLSFVNFATFRWLTRLKDDSEEAD